MSKMQKVLGAELTDVLHEVSHALCQEAAKNEPHTGLTSPEKKAHQLEMQTTEAFEKLASEYQKAALVLLETVRILEKSRKDIHYKAIAAELQEAGKKLNADTFWTCVNDTAEHQHLEPKKVYPISEATLNTLCDAATYLLEEKRFEDAMPAFSLLCSLEPNVYRHWVGYGHAAFHNQQYDTAILAYYMATSLHSSSPWPLIWAANAAEQKNELEAAHDLLERAQELAHHSSDKETHELAPKLKERLKKLSVKTKNKA